MSIVSVHVDFLKHLKFRDEAVTRAHVFKNIQDFVVVTGLLVEKLITREGDNGQTLGVVFIVQIIQFRVVWYSLASEGRYVHGEHNLTVKLREGHVRAVQAKCRIGRHVLSGWDARARGRVLRRSRSQHHCKQHHLK